MRITTLFMFITMAFAASVLLSGNAPAAEKTTITVATNPSFVPFESRDPKTGKMVGFDIELLRAVARQAGLDYTFRVMDFNGIIPALLTGSVDMAITGMTITAERAKKVSFSDPYYDSGLRLMVKNANNQIHNLKDLSGKTVATELATTSFTYLKKHAPQAKVIAFPQSNQMYMALMSNNAVAVLFDVPSIQYYIRKKGHGQVKVVGPLYAGQQYGMAFPKGSKLVESVNDALAALKRNGKFAALYQKWFGQKPPQDLMSEKIKIISVAAKLYGGSPMACFRPAPTHALTAARPDTDACRPFNDVIGLLFGRWRRASIYGTESSRRPAVSCSAPLLHRAQVVRCSGG